MVSVRGSRRRASSILTTTTTVTAQAMRSSYIGSRMNQSGCAGRRWQPAGGTVQGKVACGAKASLGEEEGRDKQAAVGSAGGKAG